MGWRKIPAEKQQTEQRIRLPDQVIGGIQLGELLSRDDAFVCSAGSKTAPAFAPTSM